MHKGRLVARGSGLALKSELEPRVIVHSDWVDNGYLMFEHDVPARVLGTPHVHANEDQVAIVMEGTIGFRIGEDEFVATAGDLVLRPRGLPHALWNPTDEPARMIELSNPGQIEQYFLTLGDLITHDGHEGDIRTLAAEWGIEYRLEMIPDLESQHGVSHVAGLFRH